MVVTLFMLYIVYARQQSIKTEGLNKVSIEDQKKALILHGWGAGPEMHWFPEEKAILEDMGYDVTIPLMPNNHNPKEKSWVKIVEDFKPGSHTVLIGHSLGGTTILEYLETENVKVDTVVLVVTPIEYTDTLEQDGFEGFKLHVRNLATDAFLKACDYEEIYDWGEIKKSANKFILIYKTDDVRVPTVQGELLAEKLDSKLITVPGEDHGHKFDLGYINRALKNEEIN